MAHSVARLTPAAAGRNTVVTRTVDIFFHRSPQLPGGAAARGIPDIDWRVTSGGSPIANGRTGADGKVTVPIRSGRPSLLEVLIGGNPVATYTITERRVAAEATTSLHGQQRRLRSMGYHLGSGEVDGQMGRITDRAILEFQADQAVDMDGVVGPVTRGQFTAQAGY